MALVDHPQFPNYPNLPSESDISAGLASALSASALLGTHGAVALLLSLFLAVTSCASAELIVGVLSATTPSAGGDGGASKAKYATTDGLADRTRDAAAELLDAHPLYPGLDL